MKVQQRELTALVELGTLACTVFKRHLMNLDRRTIPESIIIFATSKIIFVI